MFELAIVASGQVRPLGSLPGEGSGSGKRSEMGVSEISGQILGVGVKGK